MYGRVYTLVVECDPRLLWITVKQNPRLQILDSSSQIPMYYAPFGFVAEVVFPYSVFLLDFRKMDPSWFNVNQNILPE
jgi:hypothetical protein